MLGAAAACVRLLRPRPGAFRRCTASPRHLATVSSGSAASPSRQQQQQPPLLIVESAGGGESGSKPGSKPESPPDPARVQRWLMAGTLGVLVYLSVAMGAQSYFLDRALRATRGEVAALQGEVGHLRGRLDVLEGRAP